MKHTPTPPRAAAACARICSFANEQKLIMLFTVLLLRVIPAFSQISQPEQKMIEQQMPNPVPKSPNVAAIDKFGDYPVSYFTGQPDISIPILEAKSGQLSVPITLSYQATGVKPTDVASWVGLGWSISEGGQLSRDVKGKRDEEYLYTNTINFSAATCTDNQYLRALANGSSDSEPDIFSYSFPGKSGKFTLGPNGGDPFLFPYAPIVINTTYASGAFSKFEIIDDKGVSHLFGKNSAGTAAIEQTAGTNGGTVSINATTAWRLMEMVAPNSPDRITFDFQNVGTATSYDVSDSYTVQDGCYGGTGGDQIPFSAGSGPCPFPYLTFKTLVSTTSVNQQGLQTLTFKGGKAVFVLSDSNRTDQLNLKRLDHIDIYSGAPGSYILKKTVKFIYSYFTLTSGPSSNLRLDEVRFLSSNGQVIEKYKFTYHTNTFSWDGTDPNFPYYRDLWGYYNGATQNRNLILPRVIGFTETPSSPADTLHIGCAYDRTVHPQYAKEGVLKRIDFPTGGYTEFDFENNRYDKSGVTTLAGGLRVTKITSVAGYGNAPKVKRYKYGASESGLGAKNFTEEQYNYMSEQHIVGIPCSPALSSIRYDSRSYFSTSALNTAGIPIMYPYVTEYFGDSTGTIGKTVYEYDAGTPMGDIPQYLPHAGKAYWNDYSWKRGKLTKTTMYDSANNKLTEKGTLYIEAKATDQAIALGVSRYYALVGQGMPSCSSLSCYNEVGDLVMSTEFVYNSFFQRSGFVADTYTSEKTFDPTNPAYYSLKETYKEYDTTHFQLSWTKANRANTNEQSVSVNRYPWQLSANSSSTGTAKGIYMLNSKNIVSTPVETYTYLQTADTAKRVVSGQVTTYKANPSNTTQVIPDQIYVWESAAPLAKASYTELAVNGSNNGLTMDSRHKSRITMGNYDELGNLLSASKTNDVPVSYIYGYDRDLAVAEIKNAQNTELWNPTNVASVSLGGAWPGTIQTTVNFTSTAAGTVVFRLGVSTSPAYTTNASYTSDLGVGSFTVPKGACGGNVINFTNVPAGAHYVTVTLTTPDSGVGGLGACGEIDYPKYNLTSGYKEFLYEGFEESAVTGVVKDASIAHSGDYCFVGDYTVAYNIPNARAYLVEYWYRDTGNVWRYISKTYTGSSMVLNEGNAIDDVRIYPKDAQMKTYTHDPLLGLRSVIDESGRMYLYDYDGFGRLFRIRNDKGNVEKQYLYNYKGN